MVVIYYTVMHFLREREREREGPCTHCQPSALVQPSTTVAMHCVCHTITQLTARVVVVVVGCAAHTEPNYKADSYSSVNNVYKGQHNSHVPLGLGTGVLELLLTLFTLRELTKVVALYIELYSSI